MEKEIHVLVKATFGTTRFYPNCPLSLLICELLETKCIGETGIEKIAKNGFKIFYKGDLRSSLLEQLKAIKE